jgi:tetratricopeptide (TPR) repeat protein
MDDVTSSAPRGASPRDVGRTLMTDVEAFLAQGDESGLREVLSARWSRETLRTLLGHMDDDVARTAALSLGLVGEFADTPALAEVLHHDDYFVVTMAERALWNIWLNASTADGNDLLGGAISAIHACDFTQAERLLDRILILDADFAEAVNQRAVMLFLTGRYESSIIACHRTLALNPHHFGAAAGLGHNHVQRGQHRAAVAAYRRALRIHPRMEGVRQALRQARAALADDVLSLRWPQPADTLLSFAEAVRQSRGER